MPIGTISKKGKYCRIRYEDPENFNEKIITRGKNKGKKRKFYIIPATSKRVKGLNDSAKYEKFFNNEEFGAKVIIGQSKKTGKTEIQALLIPNKHCGGFCPEGGHCSKD